MERYDQTSGALAREAAVTVPTVQLYAKLGLLDFVTASNGARLFRRGQAQQVRDVLAQRMAGRGRKAR